MPTAKFKGNLPRWLQEAGVPAEETDACLKWAFGENWSAWRIRDWVGLWNGRHGDLFKIGGFSIPMASTEKSLKRIGRAYLKAKKNV